MVDAIKPLYTAHATATGGRNGHTRSDDGIVDVDLSVPKEMGGPGKPNTATPEHLFAAGYAACFGGALDYVAKQHKKDASKATVKCAVTIGPREKGGFGLAVVLDVTDASLPQSELQVARQRGARKDLPLQPRHARQRRRRGRRPRGLSLGRVPFPSFAREDGATHVGRGHGFPSRRQQNQSSAQRNPNSRCNRIQMRFPSTNACFSVGCPGFWASPAP